MQAIQTFLDNAALRRGHWADAGVWVWVLDLYDQLVLICAQLWLCWAREKEAL